MVDLLKSAQQLQKEAFDVLNELKIFSKLTKIGNPKLIGSVKNGLMVWRDIDLEVYVRKYNLNSCLNLINELVSYKNIIAFGLYDFTASKISKSGFMGIYMYFLFKDKMDYEWKIDIWLLDFIPKPRSFEKFIDNATDEQKRVILSIKEKMHRTPLYKKYVISIDIYKAVLEGGVKNFNDFKSYMLKEGRLINTKIKHPDNFDPD